MSVEFTRLRRPLAERDEELTILQKAATYFARHLKWIMSSLKNISLSSALKPCVGCSGFPEAAGISGVCAIISRQASACDTAVRQAYTEAKQRYGASRLAGEQPE